MNITEETEVPKGIKAKARKFFTSQTIAAISKVGNVGCYKQKKTA